MCNESEEMSVYLRDENEEFILEQISNTLEKSELALHLKSQNCNIPNLKKKKITQRWTTKTLKKAIIKQKRNLRCVQKNDALITQDKGESTA